MKRVAGFAVIALAGVFAAAAAQDRQAAGTAQGKKDPHGHMMKLTGDMPKDMRMMNQMMVHHVGKKDPDFEKRFIDIMIPHHEGAILMAKQALREANRPELKEMAEKTIKDQEKEIAQLKKWRQEWYGGER